MRAPVWFFDLDDTLHDVSHAIFAAIDARMIDYVARHLMLDPARASALRESYWRRYGATLLGLVRHHAIDAHHFLHETHDFDVTPLVRAERGLRQILRRLRGRKVLLPNAPDAYAADVLRALGLTRALARRYAIESMRVRGQFRPKPSRPMLLQMRARERVAGRSNCGRAILIEDNAINLKAARAAGFATVLLTQHHGAARMRAGRPSYVDVRLRSLRDLVPAAARWQWGYAVRS